MSPRYGCQRFYEDAILETDRFRLPVLIRAAHAAIDARMDQLRNDGHDATDERQAIEDARSGLRVLKDETDSR